MSTVSGCLSFARAPQSICGTEEIPSWSYERFGYGLGRYWIKAELAEEMLGIMSVKPPSRLSRNSVSRYRM